MNGSVVTRSFKGKQECENLVSETMETVVGGLKKTVLYDRARPGPTREMGCKEQVPDTVKWRHTAALQTAKLPTLEGRSALLLVHSSTKNGNNKSCHLVYYLREPVIS
jgi:hypothetical protein